MIHAWRIKPPFRNQTVRRHAAMQRTGCDSVAIRQITAGDGAQTHEIQVSVFNLKWIERPFDKFYPALQSVFALKQFQTSPDSTIAIIFQNGGHVRMKEYLPLAKSGDGQSESNHLVDVKRAQNLTARFRGNHKKRQRHIQFCFAPHASLKFKTFSEFVQAVAVANFNLSGLSGS